jgi:hypothetical protein
MSEMPGLAASFSDAAKEFNAAWANPNNTTFELPAVDVNLVLRQRYTLGRDLKFTRTMLWDMEAKKAWDPKSYIPYVVSQGGSWDRRSLGAGTEHFYRASMQAGWITEGFGQVLEEVFIDHSDRRVLFMGRPHFKAETGETLRAGDHQPLFHVQHGADGSETDPLNTWRIVFLTETPDLRLTEPFRQMAAAGMLPGFVELYIERDCGVTLSRRA